MFLPSSTIFKLISKLYRNVGMSVDVGSFTESAQASYYHEVTNPHHRMVAARFSEAILGGQDGLVNTLGVVLGVAAVSQNTRIVLASGMAAALAESISMFAVAYTSKLADASFYESERQREHVHIERVPELEREEVQALFKKKGFEGELLVRIVDKICSDPNVWVDFMMDEEHHLAPITKEQAIRSAIVVFLSALLGSLIPLAPFPFLEVDVAIWISLAVCVLTLFVVGAYKAAVMGVGSKLYGGTELAIIGTVSALAGWGVGLAFNALYPEDAPKANTTQV